MKKFFLMFVPVIILIAFSYWGYPIVKSRYFNGEPKTIQNRTDQQNPSDENTSAQKNINIEGEIKSDSIGITISPSDCDNECSRFKKDEELKYCQQACGLPSFNQEGIEIKPTTDCENTAGLQKDYCLKDSAVKNKDFKACDQINDSGIEKTCKDRISEDIIESQ